MSKATNAKDEPGAMLFAGALYSEEERYRLGRRRLEERFGPIALETPALPWEYSDYYREELGWPIRRRFVFFQRLIREDGLRDIKLAAVTLEQELSRDGQRTVNIDPGCLTLAKVVLASTKDYAHRIALGGGIYGEVTLIYRKDRFHPHLFTYRDYRDNTDVFKEARKMLAAKRSPPLF